MFNKVAINQIKALEITSQLNIPQKSFTFSVLIYRLHWVFNCVIYSYSHDIPTAKLLRIGTIRHLYKR